MHEKKKRKQQPPKTTHNKTTTTTKKKKKQILTSSVSRFGGEPYGSVVRCLASTSLSADGPAKMPAEPYPRSHTAFTIFGLPCPNPASLCAASGKVKRSAVIGSPTVPRLADCCSVIWPPVTPCCGMTAPSARRLTVLPSRCDCPVMVLANSPL